MIALGRSSFASRRRRIGDRVAMVGVSCAAILGASQYASAAPINLGFESITNNSAESSDIAEAQMSVVISDEGSNTVLFKFFNTGPDDATIAEIYFDDDVPILDENGVVIAYSGAGIEFNEGANPANLPAGNTIAFSSTYEAQAENPAPQNGVNPGEWVSFLFNLVGGIAFGDLASAIDSGEFRMGLHIVAFENGESESLVNNPPGDTPVPEPASMLLLALGTIGMGGYARRRNRLKESAAA